MTFIFAFGGNIANTFHYKVLTAKADCGLLNSKYIYIVKKGDTIWSIAKKHKGEYEDINNVVNHIKYVNNIEQCIYPGQKLIITSVNY